MMSSNSQKDDDDNVPIVMLGRRKPIDFIGKSCDAISAIIVSYLDPNTWSECFCVNKNYHKFMDAFLRNRFSFIASPEDSVLFALNQHVRIPQSTSVLRLRISVKKLEAAGCKYILKRNAHYKSAAPMKLYELGDVLLLVFQRFGSLQKLHEYNQLLLKRKTTRNEDPAYQARIQESKHRKILERQVYWRIFNRERMLERLSERGFDDETNDETNDEYGTCVDCAILNRAFECIGQKCGVCCLDTQCKRHYSVHRCNYFSAE
jgi:hypothetical protein